MSNPLTPERLATIRGHVEAVKGTNLGKLGWGKHCADLLAEVVRLEKGWQAEARRAVAAEAEVKRLRAILDYQHELDGLWGGHADER